MPDGAGIGARFDGLGASKKNGRTRRPKNYGEMNQQLKHLQQRRRPGVGRHDPTESGSNLNHAFGVVDTTHARSVPQCRQTGYEPSQGRDPGLCGDACTTGLRKRRRAAVAALRFTRQPLDQRLAMYIVTSKPKRISV